MNNFEAKNYCILSNQIDKKFLLKFSDYPILAEKYSFDELRKKLEFFASKQVVLVNSFYYLNDEEIKRIIELLNQQKINYINITSNIEEALYSDYMIVYEEENKVIEGNTKDVLQEEKLLKRLGYGLPFVVDLSLQLKLYGVLDKVIFDMDTLMEKLWN